MTHKIRISELPEFDVTAYLGDDQAIAEYLTAVLEDGDPALLTAALGDVARARGMTDIARLSGLSRESLYKALRPNAHPRMETVLRVLTAMGITLQARTTAAST